MDHRDHVALLAPGVPSPGGVWADLGSGDGAFTLALAELLGPEGTIFSVDRDGRALGRQARALSERFPLTVLHTLQADFSEALALPPLDGLVMANSLHFVRHPLPVVKALRQLLKPDGRFILVEYNTDRGNTWVPYPLIYSAWAEIAAQAGFDRTVLLGRRPSRFLHEIYSASSH